MSKIAHECDSSKRKLASSTTTQHVHVCAMPDHASAPPPWYAELYPYVDATTYDPLAARRAALQTALKIEETTAAKNREWINRICTLAKVTPTQLAREAALSPSTINRFLKQTTSSANLGASTLAAIMEAGERLIDSALQNNLHDVDYIRKLSELRVHENVKPFRLSRDVTIIGCIRTSLFAPADTVQYSPEMFFDVKIPVRGAHEDKLVVGFEYFTDHPGDLLADEDLVFGVPLLGQNFELSEGDRVVLNRRNAKAEVETSLRDVFFDKKDGCWLAAVGGETEQFPPVYLGKDPRKLHSEELSVSFLVVGSYHWTW
ncbi:hypothetical protein [Methylorubrum thiocyanatum]|uniref:hypothetical protein n=1 Tax=Methylorubrum thiocyanatum TaxID=47958 RepID=UPI003F7D7C4D